MKKIMLWIITVIFGIMLFAAFFVDVEFATSIKDIILYRLSIICLFAVWEFGVILELDIFHIKDKIPLLKERNIIKHLLFWAIIMVSSVVFFSLIQSFESPDFKLAQQQQIDAKKEKSNKISDSKDEIESELTNNVEKKNRAVETPPVESISKKTSLETEDNIKQTSMTWNELLANKKRYKQVLMLVGKYYRKGKLCTSLKKKLSSEEVNLIQDMFNYCKENDDLPKEMQKSFTEFCKAEEYENMDLDCDDNKFYHEVSKGFQISWNYTDNRPNFYISLYDIPETDYSPDKKYLDAERYIDKGCILYVLKNGKYKKYAKVKDVIYGEMIKDVCYGFGIKLKMYDKKNDVKGYKDGEAFFNNARSKEGIPTYYVSVYDLNRSPIANSIDYEKCWDWKPLREVSSKEGLDVYLGMKSCKRYLFTILECKASENYILVKYPNGNEEVKYYSAIVNNKGLFVIDN